MDITEAVAGYWKGSAAALYNKSYIVQNAGTYVTAFNNGTPYPFLLSQSSPLNPRPFVTSPYISSTPWQYTNPNAAGYATQLAYYIQQTDALGQSWQNYYPEAESFPSGHSTAGNTIGIFSAILAPQYYKDLVKSGIDFGLARNQMGMHYPLDTLAGRLIATYNIAQYLIAIKSIPSGQSITGPNFGTITNDIASARSALQGFIGSINESPYASQCQAGVIACIRSGAIPSAVEFREARHDYTKYLNYDLGDLGSLGNLGRTDLDPVVPDGAEVLIESRFPYLTADQRRRVLATTEIPSGSALDNGTGWARLDLYAAADGFRSLNEDETIKMHSSDGGYSAFDVWANDITGPGGLTLSGDGTLVLAGDSTYTGGTTVDGGTLAVTGSIVGAVDVASGATFYNAGTVTALNGSVVTNAGTLVNDGIIASSVTNSGSLTNTGSIVVAAGQTFSNTGTVTGEGNGLVTNDGTFVNNSLFASNLVNGGTATNNGTITGSVYNTGTFVNPGTITGSVANAGAFNNNGTVGGSFTDAGLLSGNGTIGGLLTIASGGVVAPGNSIGTLHVGGNVVFQPGSTYAVQIDGSGASDLIQAGGTASIAGALNVALASGGVYGLQTFTILTAAGGVTGRFSAINDPFGTNYPFLDAALVYGANGVELESVRSSVPLASVAQNANQASVATALDTLTLGTPFMNAVISLNASTAPAAFTALSGGIYPSVQTVLQAQSVYLRDAVTDRLRQAAGAAAAPAVGPKTAALIPGLLPTV